MTYLQKNNFGTNKSGLKRKKSFFVVLIISIILVLFGLFSPNLIPGKLNEIGKPLWKFRELLVQKLTDTKDFLNTKKSLIENNNKLKEENINLKQKLVTFNLLEKENEELKNILGRESGDNRTIARVLSKARQSPYGTIVIDIGNEKVFIGQEVFYEDSIIIGLIDEVYDNTAKVKLLSAPGNKYEVEIGEESIPGHAEGLGNGNFEIKLPRGVDVSKGDEIVSPNLSIKLLGIVEHIDLRPENSLQTILFKTPVNINQIKWVEIISN
jgi:rod shape-determining protein MreC